MLGHHAGEGDGLVVAQGHVLAPEVLEAVDQLLRLGPVAPQNVGVLQGGAFQGLVAPALLTRRRRSVTYRRRAGLPGR